MFNYPFENPFEKHETIRIDQNCIFCGQFTNEVQQQTFDNSKTRDDKYYKDILTVPFPAHKKCLTKAKWLDGLIIFGIMILSLYVTAGISSIFVTPSSEPPSNYDNMNPIICLGIMAAPVLAFFSIREYTKRWKKRWENVIMQYYKSHRL